MTRERRLLFYEGRLDGWLDQRTGEALERVQQLPKGQFLNSSDDDVAAHVASMFEVEPLSLRMAEATVDPRETTMDARAFPGAYAVFGLFADVCA